MAAFYADEQRIVVVAHPDVTIGRVEQAKLPVASHPIIARPVDGGQILTVDPSAIVPAAWSYITLNAIAVSSLYIPVIRRRIEGAAIGRPLGRIATGLVFAPVVALVLLNMLLLLDLALILVLLRRPLLRLLLLPILLVSVPVILRG